MMPLIPHFASECLQDLKDNSIQKWPKADKKFLDEENINFVIQINGKKKLILNTSKGISEEMLIKMIKNDNKTNQLLQNKKIIRSIFVKNKLINLIIKNEKI